MVESSGAAAYFHRVARRMREGAFRVPGVRLVDAHLDGKNGRPKAGRDGR